MAVVAALLFLTVMTLCLVLVGIGYYYMRVVQPQLQAAKGAEPSEPSADAEPQAQAAAHAEAAALTTFVEQLQELARLRDQGILTSKEFTSKKTQLLDRI